MDIPIRELADFGLSGAALIGVGLLYKSLIRHEDGCSDKWRDAFHKLEEHSKAIANMDGKVDILLQHDEKRNT